MKWLKVETKVTDFSLSLFYEALVQYQAGVKTLETSMDLPLEP